MQGGMGPGELCKPVGDASVAESMYSQADDDKSKSDKKKIDDDKGRGSYRCGRCGVPKKGHVCPYQPKLKRRPDEPPPEMRCAAIQVEMDEFMTLRRLNIQIQGFPESYATDPIMAQDMCVGEPRMPAPPMSAPMSSGMQHSSMLGSEVGPPPMPMSSGAPTSPIISPSARPPDQSSSHVPMKDSPLDDGPPKLMKTSGTDP
mmetsp:Transcript_16499/g.23269  ORF Transcript_16499/g.23269 Transcript_16499/m.23269 type:complete len:202 (-) Transcript_16499:140-745(-)